MTQSKLKEYLHYCPDTGVFTNLTHHSPRYKNRPTGVQGIDGYMRISIKKKIYNAHRLAFLYMEGELPEFVDHINHERSDNRWSNLRAVTRQQNNKNRSIGRNNTSGVNGVIFVKRLNKWEARISVEGKRILLGRFRDKADAVSARLEANTKYGYHTNHGL